MKKAIITVSVLVLIALMITSIVPRANAHPGRTDSKGGHTDSSTGEYHYHHGYSAHDHYDMDGDGDIDCPYDFVEPTTIPKESSKSRSDSHSRDIWGTVAIFVLLVGFWFLPAFINRK